MVGSHWPEGARLRRRELEVRDVRLHDLDVALERGVGAVDGVAAAVLELAGDHAGGVVDGGRLHLLGPDVVLHEGVVLDLLDVGLRQQGRDDDDGEHGQDQQGEDPAPALVARRLLALARRRAVGARAAAAAGRGATATTLGEARAHCPMLRVRGPRHEAPGTPRATGLQPAAYDPVSNLGRWRAVIPARRATRWRRRRHRAVPAAATAADRRRTAAGAPAAAPVPAARVPSPRPGRRDRRRPPRRRAPATGRRARRATRGSGSSSAVLGWLAGQVLSAVVLVVVAGANGHSHDLSELAPPHRAAGVGRRLRPGRPVDRVPRCGRLGQQAPRAPGTSWRDMRWGFRRWDPLIGVGVGLVGQFVLLPLLYLPLQFFVPHLSRDALPAGQAPHRRVPRRRRRGHRLAHGGGRAGRRGAHVPGPRAARVPAGLRPRRARPGPGPGRGRHRGGLRPRPRRGTASSWA